MAENTTKRNSNTKKFQPGDFAVYPVHGVGRIESIEHREINGSGQNFYIMKILENDMIIMIPTTNTATVGLRGVTTRRELQKIYNVFKNKRSNMIYDHGRNYHLRQKEYMDMLKSGNLHDVAKVFRDLYLLQFTKELSFEERKLFDKTRNLLLKELSIAKNMDENDVMSEIKSIIPEEQENTRKNMYQIRNSTVL